MWIQAPGLSILSWEVCISVASCIYLKYPLSGLLIQKHVRGHRNPFLCRPFSWCGLTLMVLSHPPKLFAKKKKKLLCFSLHSICLKFKLLKGSPFFPSLGLVIQFASILLSGHFLTWMGLENWPAGFFSFFFSRTGSFFGCESASALDSVHWVLKPLKTAVHRQRAFNPATETTL